MKYLTILFSVYMTLLALLPCQDREDRMMGVMRVTIQRGHACNEQGGKESCPPFCTCSCCSTTRLLTPKQAVPVFSITIVRNYPELKAPAVRQQPITIWQPPQIG